jgi:hypothetical protein
MITEHELGEQAHRLIKNNKFEEIDLQNIEDEWAVKIVGMFIEPHNITWSICAEKIGLTSIVKLEDDYLKHILIMPYKSYEGQKCDQFYWLTGDDPNIDEHGIHPDVASAYLLNKSCPGIKLTDVKHDDGSSVTKMTLPNGKQVILRMPKKTFDDDTWAK